MDVGEEFVLSIDRMSLLGELKSCLSWKASFRLHSKGTAFCGSTLHQEYDVLPKGNFHIIDRAIGTQRME